MCFSKVNDRFPGEISSVWLFNSSIALSFRYDIALEQFRQGKEKLFGRLAAQHDIGKRLGICIFRLIETLGKSKFKVQIRIEGPKPDGVGKTWNFCRLCLCIQVWQGPLRPRAVLVNRFGYFPG